MRMNHVTLIAHCRLSFEHAFVGEIKGTGVSGFHNWMYFYEQEQSGEFNYQGYLSNQTPRMVGMRHTWYGATKPINGFTIGTSPEIEFALYSLCHLSRPNSRRVNAMYNIERTNAVHDSAR